MNRIARQSIVRPSEREVDCPACGGLGTYRMGCALAICHVCRGRTRVFVTMGVPSSPERNRRPGGGERETNRTILLLGLLCLLACASEGLATVDAQLGEAGAPPRGPGILPDAMPADAVQAEEVLLGPDVQAGPEVRQGPEVQAGPDVQDARRTLADLPRCEDRDAGTGTNIMCSATSRLPDGGTVRCLAVAADGGYFGAVPCFFPTDGVATNRVYVASCEECPL